MRNQGVRESNRGNEIPRLRIISVKICSMVLITMLIILLNSRSYNLNHMERSPYDNVTIDEQVGMTIINKEFNTLNKQVMISLKNSKDTDITYGADTSLEVFLDDNWYQVPYRNRFSTHAVILITYSLPSGGEQTLTIELSSYWIHINTDIGL